MIYLDTSALVKLLFDELESEMFANWIDERPEIPKVTSDLSVVELLRTCRRVDASQVAVARRLLDGVDLIPIGSEIVERAALLDPLELRSLDAIHLASAVSLGDDLTYFVAYDHRLCAAALEEKLPIISPS